MRSSRGIVSSWVLSLPAVTWFCDLVVVPRWLVHRAVGTVIMSVLVAFRTNSLYLCRFVSGRCVSTTIRSLQIKWKFWRWRAFPLITFMRLCISNRRASAWALDVPALDLFGDADLSNEWFSFPVLCSLKLLRISPFWTFRWMQG